MKSLCFGLLALSSVAVAQTTTAVLVRPIPQGIRLDAGSGPKEFTCKAGKVFHALKVGNRTVNTTGTYLMLTLQDNTFRMEMTEKSLSLQGNQVRLSCKGTEIQAKFGDLIIVKDAQD